jgi:hypothetical protein
MKTSKMKTSINLKTRKMKNNYLKLGMMAAVMLSASIGFAQTTDATTTAKGITKGAGAGESIKVIDNKGTIKYLQTNNGITSITSTANGSETTTTWQLGGTLVDATTITTSATGTFTIDGVEFNLANTGINASDAATTTDDTGTGYTLLVREENTGRVSKMLATDLIEVLWAEDILDLTAPATADFTIDASGILSTTDVYRVSVYRNGAKLRAGTDYQITTDDKVDIKVAGFGSAYDDDVFEVHFIK